MRPIDLIRKSLAVLLAAVLLIGLVPAGAAATSQPAADSSSEPSDVWDAIDALEEEKFAEMPRLMDADDTPTLADYAQVVDDVAAMVVTRSDYVEGSFHRNGDFIFWKTTDGEINAYSPDLRADNEKDGAQFLSGSGAALFGGAEGSVSEAQLMEGEDPSEASLARVMDGETDERDIAVLMPWACPPDVDAKKTNPYTFTEHIFTSMPYHEAEMTAAYTGGRADWIWGHNVTIDAVADAIASYGMVIIYTHGRTDYNYHEEDQFTYASDSYIQLQSSDGLTKDDYTYGVANYDNRDKGNPSNPYKGQDWGSTKQDVQPYKNYSEIKAQNVGYYPHCFKFRKKKANGTLNPETRYAVDGYVIARHMGDRQAPGNMVYFLGCLTMATDGLWRPLREKGVEVVYGYSQSVDYRGGYSFFQPFMEGLRQGKTAGQAFDYMREQAGADWDPFYNYTTVADAADAFVAFPYMVSPQDAFYDRDDYVNTIRQEPKSTWKLPVESRNGELIVSVEAKLNEPISVPVFFVDSNVKQTGFEQEGHAPKGMAFKRENNADDYRHDSYCVSGTVTDSSEIGYGSTLLTISFSDGTTKKIRIKYQISSEKEYSAQANIVLEAGKYQTTEFNLSKKPDADYLKVEKIYGEIPSGMTLRYFEGMSAPDLVGTPMVAKDYQPIFLVRLKNGRVIQHRMNIRVTPTETLDTNQNLVLYGDVLRSVAIETGLDLGDETISAIGKTTGAIPGMKLTMSMDESPRLTGTPTTIGDYTMTVQFCISDGRVINHTIYATVQRAQDPIDKYVVDVSTGQSGVIDWSDYSKHIRPALRAAAAAGQIDLTEAPDKVTINVDKDKGSDTPDIEYSKVMNSYRFQVLSTASQSGSYVLTLSDAALKSLSGDTNPYAKSIEFIFSQVYGLKVWDTQVTSANREDILKGRFYGGNLSGIFSYDGAGTLTINGSLWSTLLDVPIVESDIPLTIRVLGYSHLACGPSAIVANRDLTITGPGKLEVQSYGDTSIQMNNGAKLTIRDAEVSANKYNTSAAGPLGIGGEGGELEIDHAHVLSYGQKTPVNGFRSIKLNNCLIKKPDRGSVDTHMRIVDGEGKVAEEVEIIPCEATYDLWIDGVQVTDVNAADILGDGDFSYSAGSKTLTINASVTRSWNHYTDRGFPMIRSAIQGLTIRAENDLVLANDGTGGCLQLEGETTLIAKHLSLNALKNAAISVRNDGTLRIKDTPYLSIVTKNGPGITGTPGFAKASDDKLILDHVDFLWIKTWDSGEAIANFAGGAGIANGDYDTKIKSPGDAKFENGAVVHQNGDTVTELVIGKVGQSGSQDPEAPELPDDSSTNYSLRVDGNLVTNLNQEDVLNNDIFSFDGDHTLTLRGGEYTVTDTTIIENGVSGLVVNVEKDTTLKVLGSKGVCLLALADTTVTGPGKLTLYSEGDEALGAGYGADITLKDLALTIDGGHGIRGSGALRVINCDLDLNTTDGAIWDFGNGILLTDCALTAPVEGSIAQADGRWCAANDDGTKALTAKVGAASAAISLTPEGDAIQYSIPLNAGGAKGTLIAAWYNDAGQMLGTSQAEITMDGTVTGDPLPVEKGADTYKLFVLDANGSPVRQAWSSRD